MNLVEIFLFNSKQLISIFLVEKKIILRTEDWQRTAKIVAFS